METRIDEIADRIYRLSTYAPEIAPLGGFTFNQFLVLGDEPLLFHTGKRRMFSQVCAALARVLPPERLRWMAFGHYEADE
jgi:flavorubredoxin